MNNLSSAITKYCMNTECNECEKMIDYDLGVNEFRAILVTCDCLFKEEY